MADDSWLIVGLGNPGPEYSGNRHNAGFFVVDLLADRMRSKFKAHKGRADVVEGHLGGSGGTRVILAKPKAYMNESGGPVAGLLRYFSVDLEHLIVVHDELDIPAGEVRLKRGGGEGGHNGLRSISASLGTRDYQRVRVGIGRPPGRMDPADFVLRDFSGPERAELPFTLDTASDAVESLLEVGLLDSQQRFHAPG